MGNRLVPGEAQVPEGDAVKGQGDRSSSSISGTSSTSCPSLGGQWGQEMLESKAGTGTGRGRRRTCFHPLPVAQYEFRTGSYLVKWET